MADRTAVQLKIPDCPPEQVSAVLEIIERRGLHLEFVEDGQPNDDQLRLDLVYMDHEISCGSAVQIAQELRQKAPDASWEVSEDPAYEWLGDIHRFTPALGMWSTDSAADGEPVFTAEKINCILAEGRIHPERIDEKLGNSHAEALLRLTETNRDVILDRT